MVRIISEEHRKNLRLSHLGYKHSTETRDKMRLRHLGYSHSEETKKKISKANKGRKLSVEAQIKAVATRKANGSYRHSKEWGEMISKKLKGKKKSPMSEQTKRKIANFHKGKKHSSETKEKMSAAHMGKQKSLEHRRNISNAKKGKNSNFYKDGLGYARDTLRHAIMRTFEYRVWRGLVFERDKYTCLHCEKKGGELNADHIKQFSLFIKEYNIKTVEEALKCKQLWNISNGRTLCNSCHKKTKTWGLHKGNQYAKRICRM